MVCENLCLVSPHMLTKHPLYQAQQQVLGADTQRLETQVIPPFGGLASLEPLPSCPGSDKVGD